MAFAAMGAAGAGGTGCSFFPDLSRRAAMADTPRNGTGPRRARYLKRREVLQE